MPSDLQTVAQPQFILMAWAGGVALAAGAVAWMSIVGRGFTWLTAGTAMVIGLAGALGEGALWARVGLAGVVIALVAARSSQLAGVALVIGGLGFVIDASLLSAWIPALTAALALGGVTAEMMLGHWYLVDPRLPRWSLRMLAIAGIAGLVADAVVLPSMGDMPAGGPTVAFWVLAVTSVVLMAAVVAAIRYPAYSGVMAATGLSYLAVLTSLGAVFLGRALLAGLGPFAS
ncbi:MAG: hypothetical protein R3258_01795 [Acidimicrobiia bacterium]|nr:hypothetical protein [Acidimicrobiia bacterium]